ncbi:kinase-like protein [Marasmius fiardii PR-910]|nr:kinase-like protein [Marasmius fiardii PR-910]
MEAPQPVRCFEDLHQYLVSSMSLRILQEVLTVSESWPASAVVEWLQEEINSATLGGRYRQRCTKCLNSLVKKYLVFPSSFFFNDIEREGNYPLGGGGFADVYKGIANSQTVCLKVLRTHTQSDEMKRKRMIEDFCQEALIWTQLDHPNVLKLLGVNTRLFRADFCLVSPWMENSDIITFLEKKPNHDRLRSVREIAAGLEYLHSHTPKIVHGDIKGANILIDESYSCRLADFGLSREALSSTTFLETSTGGAKGSVRWMAPELFDGYGEDSSKDQTPRDIYAFACTIIEIMTGKPPFASLKNDVAVIKQVCLNGARPPRPNGVWCPKNVWDLVEQCWHQDHLKRPTAKDIHAHLTTLSRLRNCPVDKDQQPPNRTPTPSAESSPATGKSKISLSQPQTHSALLNVTADAAHSISSKHLTQSPAPLGLPLERAHNFHSNIQHAGVSSRTGPNNRLRVLSDSKWKSWSSELDDSDDDSESNETLNIYAYSLSELVPLEHLSECAGPILRACLDVLQAKLQKRDFKVSVNPVTGVIYHEPIDSKVAPSRLRIIIENQTPVLDLLNEDVIVRFWSQLSVDKSIHQFILESLVRRLCTQETIKQNVIHDLDGPCVHSTLTKTTIAVRILPGKEFKVDGKHCIGKGKTMGGGFPGAMRAKLQGGCRRVRVVAGSRRQRNLCWPQLNAWLSQAWSIFQAHGITLTGDPGIYKLFEGKLELSGTLQKSKTKRLRRQEYPPLYLFIESSSTYFWSFDENRRIPLLQDSCKYLGLPYKLQVKFSPSQSYSFPNEVFHSVYKWQVSNGFDPHTVDYARHLGHPLYKVVLDDDRFEELNEDIIPDVNEIATGESEQDTIMSIRQLFECPQA